MKPLRNRRVLVIEDEAPVAIMLEDMLEEMGCVVAGCVASVSEALEFIEFGAFEFVVLDFNLRDGNAVPVADALTTKGIPFIIGSGYGRAGLPAHLQTCQVVQKPFLSEHLEKSIREALGERQTVNDTKRMPRHQCLIYAGPPSDQLNGLAITISGKLNSGYRCLYLNSPPMVAGIRCCLAAMGRDVEKDTGEGTLVLSSDQRHLVNGAFNPQQMLDSLDRAYHAAIREGFVGLWASGDMSWEFGPEQNFDKLAEYERKLEAFLDTHPAMCGICQYHADMLPHAVVVNGLALHRALYINETLARFNSHYSAERADLAIGATPQVNIAVDEVLALTRRS